MQTGGLRRALRRASAPPVLLPGSLREAGTALLAACVAVTAVFGVDFAGHGPAGWLDSAFDARIQAGLSRFPALLYWLPELGTLASVTMITLALVLVCVVTRRWSGAVLTVVAVPAAIGLTEYVLKPHVDVGQAIMHSFPSGHATSMFALAAICAVLLVDPPRRRIPKIIRLVLVLMALLLAAAVAAAMVAIGAHYFTDAVGGAAVGTGVVLACALALDIWWPGERGEHPVA